MQVGCLLTENTTVVGDLKGVVLFQEGEARRDSQADQQPLQDTSWHPPDQG